MTIPTVTMEKKALTSSITVPEASPARNKRSPGRTRSEAARVAILNATLNLLETQSLQQITIEAIAKEAGVGKATIYRWWPSKAAVVIDAFVQNHVVQTPMPKGGSCREAITVHLHRMVQQYGGRAGRLVAQILAEGQSEPEVLREFRERFFYGRRAMVREVIEEGRRNGEFRTDMESEFLMDMVYSPVYFRLMMGHLPLSLKFADELAASAMAVLCAPAQMQR
ncbi:TetR/AcrR family transcriptional regulator [Cupriavidus basilensis]